MNLFQRFGKFLIKFEAETTAIIVVLMLILLLFEFFFEFSGTKLFELLPTIVALISAGLLFCTLTQAINANKVNRQKVRYERYLEVLKHYEEESAEVWEFPELSKVEGFEFYDSQYSISNGSELVEGFLIQRVCERKNIQITHIFHILQFIHGYTSFYGRLCRDLLQLKTDNLLPEYNLNLLDRFADMFSNFNSICMKLEGFSYSKDGYNLYIKKQNEIIMKLLKLHQPLKELLHKPQNEHLL